MSLQTAALLQLNQAARTLDGLAEGKLLPDECRFAASRFRRAVERLSVEPLHRSEIQDALALIVEARNCLHKIHDDVKVDAPEWGWVSSTTQIYESLLHLLSAMANLHGHVSLDRPGITAMPAGLRRLLPACWWGSR